MLHRRRLLLASTVLASGIPQLARAQIGVTAAEAALRQTVAAYFEAWNHRDAAAWAEFLTEDVEWVFPYSNLKKGRPAVAAYGATSVRSYDAKFEVAKVRLYNDGTRATLLLRGQFLELPMRDGKYARVWDRDPLITRWSFKDGSWRLYYMNENVPEASELAKAEGLL